MYGLIVRTQNKRIRRDVREELACKLQQRTKDSNPIDISTSFFSFLVWRLSRHSNLKLRANASRSSQRKRGLLFRVITHSLRTLWLARWRAEQCRKCVVSISYWLTTFSLHVVWSPPVKMKRIPQQNQQISSSRSQTWLYSRWYANLHNSKLIVIVTS